MKKTLFTSILALACASAAVADYTFTSKNNAGAQSGGAGNYTSISNFVVEAQEFSAADLAAATDSWTTSCNDADIDAVTAGFTTGTTVSLDSITLYERATGDEINLTGGLVLVITGDDGSVIKSDSVSLASTETEIGTSGISSRACTFTFDAADSIVLGANYTITFEYDNGNSRAMNLAVSTTAGGNGQDWYVNTNTGYGPVGATIVTSTYNVPEPTTATLSLVALAGLMVRRRRQA